MLPFEAARSTIGSFGSRKIKAAPPTISPVTLPPPVGPWALAVDQEAISMKPKTTTKQKRFLIKSPFSRLAVKLQLIRGALTSLCHLRRLPGARNLSLGLPWRHVNDVRKVGLWPLVFGLGPWALGLGSLVLVFGL